MAGWIGQVGVADDRMESRVRKFDWATTELGEITAWHPSLTTMVQVLLSSPCPMMLWWGARSIQIYNDAARDEVIGSRDPGALGTPAAETWTDAWFRLGPAAQSVLAGHGPSVLEVVGFDLGHRRRRFTVACSPVPDGHGGVGGVLVIARESVAKERAALRAVEEQLESLHATLMQAPAAIAILRGPQHVVELSNVAMAEAWDRAPNESVGRPLFEAIPEARELRALLDRVYASGEPYDADELLYRLEHGPDGTPRPRFANALYAPLRDVCGRVDGVLVIAVDITEQVRARQEMQRLRADAEAANRAKDEFLAILGHELRNPLAPISTALQVLRMRGASGRELDVIERQVGHLTGLVDDLLDISRVTRGKLELHPQDVELADLVAGALEQTTPLVQQRQDVVDVDVPRRGLAVHVDPARMIQAVSNLMTNAVKYSDPGSRIRIRGLRTDGTVRISVRDHGIGIAPEMLGRVFDLFVQQPQAIDRSRGGLGLGLPIVRTVVELHGGSVSATSEGVGRGSEFTIELPALARDVTPSPAPPRVPAERAPTPHGRILIVDDNQDAAALLGDALEGLGYDVAVANDGPSALRIAESFDPDIALLDLGLPVMDGYELAGHLQHQAAHGANGHRPHLVAVTGYAQQADREQTARAGFERHLVKPVNLGALSQVVAELMR